MKKFKWRSEDKKASMIGVYLEAVELAKKGFIVSPTSRNAQGVDLLIETDKDGTK